MKSYIHTARLLCLLALAGVGALAGCRNDREDAPPRQFFPDLDNQLKWTPQSKSEFFADGRTMRQQAPDTVAFGRTSFVPDANNEWSAPYQLQRDQLLRENSTLYTGFGPDGKSLVEKIVVPVTMETLKIGQHKYNIYCSTCHGYLGNGKGQVGVQWATPVANFHDPMYKVKSADNGERWTDGHLYRTGMFGYYDVTGAQKMPGYAHGMSAEEGWAVVAYIRALQASHDGNIESVPADQRPALEKSRSALLEQLKQQEADKQANDKAGQQASMPATQGGVK
jgi:mono/diheme cytochrome c family protein